jgi:hypothetical protein
MSTTRAPVGDDPKDSTLPTTRRLEAKIRRLQDEIQRAESAAVESQTRATSWSNPILAGEREIIPTPLDALIVCYPHVPLQTPEGEAEPLSSGAVASGALAQRELVTVLPRESLHQELAKWDCRAEVPRALRHRL